LIFLDGRKGGEISDLMTIRSGCCEMGCHIARPWGLRRGAWKKMREEEAAGERKNTAIGEAI